MGYAPYSRTRNVSSATYYVYLSGSFTAGQAKANSLKLKVMQKIVADSVPLSDGSVAVRTGPFASQQEAAQMKSRLDGAGFPSELKAVQTTAKQYTLMAGEFITRDEAAQASAKLNARGFRAEIINLK